MRSVYTRLAFSIIMMTALIAGISLPSQMAHAQNQNSDQTLEDIFGTGDVPKSKEGAKKTSADLANEYYTECVSSQRTLLNEITQKNYCGCKAAKMAENLSREEILALKEKTREGSNARDQMRIYVEPSCMPYAVRDFSRNVCLQDDRFKKIVRGKVKVCDCAAQLDIKFLNRSFPEIIIKAATEEPMSLDPLTHYLLGADFEMIHDTSKNECYTRYIYGQND